MGRGKSADATEFWTRYEQRTKKDLAVLLSTGIRPSTLSSYKVGKRYPRADEAVAIAQALGTTVEELVTGEDRDAPSQRLRILFRDMAFLPDQDLSEIEALVAVKLGRLHTESKHA